MHSKQWKVEEMFAAAKLKEFAIPTNTLNDHVSGKHMQIGAGGPTVYCQGKSRR